MALKVLPTVKHKQSHPIRTILLGHYSEMMAVLTGLVLELWTSPSSSSFRALGSSRSSMVNLSSRSSTKDLKARFTAGSLSPGRLRFSWKHKHRRRP